MVGGDYLWDIYIPSSSFLRNFLPKFKQAVKKQPIFSKGLEALIRG
jgi:hypothetical protein